MKLSRLVAPLFICQFISLSTLSYADTQLFIDSFESADELIWTASANISSRLTSTKAFAHSGTYSAHNATGNRAVAVQQFNPVSTGTLRVNWQVYNKGTTKFDLAGFWLGDSGSLGPWVELTGTAPVSLSAIPPGGYKEGLANIEPGTWYELSIVHDFDASITRFYVQGNEVYEFSTQLTSLSTFSMRTDDAELYIDDVEIIHQVRGAEVPTNVDLVMDAFGNGIITGWTFDNPQLVAVDTFSHQSGFSVHKPVGSTGTHGLRRDFDVQSSGVIESSWWVLATGSDITNAALFHLGDALTISLQDGGTKLSLSATNTITQDFRPEIRTLPNGSWFKLGINYNFQTDTATFLLDGSVIHEVSIDVQTIGSLTLTTEDSGVYIDEVMINNSEPVTEEVESPSLAVETLISRIGINLLSRVENSRVIASWTEVPSGEGYRLYYSLTEFSDVTSIEFVDVGKTTEVDAFLPYGSAYHIAIGAYKDGENIALSNRTLVDIPALKPQLTTAVSAAGVLTASWKAIPNVENYRLYYSPSPFTTKEDISYADVGTVTDLEVKLFRGANYYIALAIKATDNPESALSNVEQVGYFPFEPASNDPLPIFPPPPTIDPSRLVGCCHMYSEQPYIDVYGTQWDDQLVPRPVVPSPPTLTPLEIFSGEAGKTVLAANSLVSSAPLNDYATYLPQGHDSVFSWGSFYKVDHFAEFSRAIANSQRQLSFGISMNFDEAEYGNGVSLIVHLRNDAGDIYYLGANNIWYKAGTYGFSPHYASGIATAGTHRALGLQYPEGMFGEMEITFTYEMYGLLDPEPRTVITEGFNVTLLPALRKLDNNGNRLPENASDWSCVHDSLTGLIWETKTDDGGLRDAKHTYTWYDSDVSPNISPPYIDPRTNLPGGRAPNGGDCVDNTNCDTEKYISQVNATNLCGASDWRMPDPYELQDLARGFSFGAPWFQFHYFNGVREHYWSGSHSTDILFNNDFAEYECDQTYVCSNPMRTKKKVMAVRKAK